MLVAHLSFQVGLEWLGNFHHFALIRLYDAEFFVLVAGLLIGWMSVNKLTTFEKRRKFIIGRIRTIYRYYLISAVPFVIAAAFVGLEAAVTACLDVLVFLDGGFYSDILPIYFFCFCFLLLIEVLTKQSTTLLGLTLSFLLYVVSQIWPQFGFMGWGDKFIVFNVAAWQFVLFLGMFVGRRYKEILGFFDGLSPNRLLAAGLGSVLLFTGVALLKNELLIQSGAKFHIARLNLWPMHLVNIFVFSLVFYLIVGKGVRFFDLAKRIAEFYLLSSIIRNVGKYSIRMFVLHVYMLALYRQVDDGLSLQGKGVLAVALIIIFVAIPNLVNTALYARMTKMASSK